MNSTNPTPADSPDSGAEAATYISGAVLLALLGIDPFEVTRLRDIVPDDRADMIVDWHNGHITMGEGFTDWRTGESTRNPVVDDVLVIVAEYVAETLGDHGVELPTRAQVRALVKADAAAGGPGVDPETERMRARDLVDPDLGTSTGVTAFEKRINGVPESIYKSLGEPARRLVEESRVIPSPQCPSYVAHWLLRKRFSVHLALPQREGNRRRVRVWMPTVTCIDGTWYRYATAPGDGEARWRPVAGANGMRALLRGHLERLHYLKGRTKDGDTIYDQVRAFTTDTKTLGEVEAALDDLLVSRGIGGTGTLAHELPDIYGERRGVYRGGTRALVRNGVLDFTTGEVTPNLPLWFSLTRIEADYDDNADPYADCMWLRMLRTQWGDDPGSITLLQQWFGYVLSGRNDLQKFLWLHGEPGSGKTQIPNVLEALAGNAAAVSLEGLNDKWGLADAYISGKNLAVIPDSRFNPRDSSLAMERLLAITGNDLVPISIKYKNDVTARLPLRFIGYGNNLPNLSDHTGALMQRMLILETTRGGIRDSADDIRDLGKKIAANPGELAAVLRWSVEGLRLLDAAQGRFERPSRDAEMRKEAQREMSNIMQFVDDCCELTGAPGDKSVFVTQDGLYRVWVSWATANKTGERMSKAKFIAALKGQEGIAAGQKPGGTRVVYGIRRAESTHLDRDKWGNPGAIKRTVSTDDKEGDPMRAAG